MTDIAIFTIGIVAFGAMCILVWELERSHHAQVKRDGRNEGRLLLAKSMGQDVYLHELPSGTEWCYAPVNEYALHVRRTSAPR